MKNISAFTAIVALTLSGCASLNDAPTDRVGSTTLGNAAGTTTGNAQMFASNNSVVITAVFFGLPAGPHAVHLHTVGQCDGPDFTSAGGHLNPGQNTHGTADGNVGHLGDLPNVTISADGRATYKATIEGPRSTLLADIFDIDGASLMVHAGPDDYRTDPSGAAGSRIACGVLKPA